MRHQGAKRSRAGRILPRLARNLGRRHDPRDKADSGAFDIALATGNLACEADMRRSFQAELAIEQHRRVDESVAVQPAQPGKLGVFQPRNGAEQPDLLGVFQLGLETHHVPQRAQLVVLTQLDHCPWPVASARIIEPNRLHRPEPQRILPARCHHLDRHAAIEVGGVRLPFAEHGLFTVEQPLVEGGVLITVHRTIDVILAVSIFAGAPKRIGFSPA